MTTEVQNAPALGNLSNALQSLHRSLLEHQAYVSGFVGSPLDLFDRANKDQEFAWLKPLRKLIVTLDERQAEATPLSVEDRIAIRKSVDPVLLAKDDTFRTKLNAAFQSDADAILAARNAREALDHLTLGRN